MAVRLPNTTAWPLASTCPGLLLTARRHSNWFYITFPNTFVILLLSNNLKLLIGHELGYTAHAETSSASVWNSVGFRDFVFEPPLLDFSCSFIAMIALSVYKYVFSARQHTLSALYAIARPSVRPSVTSVVRVRVSGLKLGLWNFHHVLAPPHPSSFCAISLILNF